MPDFGSHLTGPVRHTTKFRNQSKRAWYRDLPVGMNDPDFVQQFTDFVVAQQYNTTDYTLSSSGTGTSAGVNTNSTGTSGIFGTTVNGALLLQTGSTAGNYATVQNKVPCWLFDTTVPFPSPSLQIQDSRKVWFEAAYNVDTTGNDTDSFIGLSEIIPNPVQVGQNYAGFRILNGGSNIMMVASTAGVVTTSSAFSLGSNNAVGMAGNIVTVGFVFDNSNSLNFYMNRNFMGTFGAGTFPTAPLTQTMQVRGNAAVNRQMLVDYLYVCKNR